MTRGFDIFFDLRLNNIWLNYREAGDLRRYRAHYDVTVMQGYEMIHKAWRSIEVLYCFHSTQLIMHTLLHL